MGVSGFCLRFLHWAAAHGQRGIWEAFLAWNGVPFEFAIFTVKLWLKINIRCFIIILRSGEGFQ